MSEELNTQETPEVVTTPPEVPATPDPIVPEEPAFTPPPIPGQEPATPEANSETSWLRSEIIRSQQEQQRLQAQLDEFRFAGMEPEQVQAEQIKRREAELAAREQQITDAQVRQQWYAYYVNWVPQAEQPKLLTGENVVEWNHNVLTHLAARAQKAEAELKALQRATTKQPGEAPPPVTSGGTGTPVKKNVFDLSYKELEQLKERAKMGLYDPADVPGLD